MNDPQPGLDPDRFFNDRTPGSQEWWYFDAISHDGRDALVIVWYASLPFDPAYGRAARRHLSGPQRHPAPDPLDHCAIGLSWYRDGRTIAYALNAYRRADFHLEAAPFTVSVEDNQLTRDERGYQLRVRTPAVDGRRSITADLRFDPAQSTRPFEQDLGMPGSPHRWVLVASDCRVGGAVHIDHEPPLHFQGRGYHDHNAGAEEIGLAMRSWRWGRAHAGPITQVYYLAEPRGGPPKGLWITCRDGRPERVRAMPTVGLERWSWNPYGLRTARKLTIDGELLREHERIVDDGPFYQRWLSRFSWPGQGHPVLGLSELLRPENLHRPWFRWMVPYRLKRPTRKKGPMGVGCQGVFATLGVQPGCSQGVDESIASRQGGPSCSS